jgi:SNF2 family DNA or RNA helicase
MSQDFFDESLLKQKETVEQVQTAKDPKDLEFHLRYMNNAYYVYVEINNDRLNASEIKLIIQQHSKNPDLKESDISLLGYVSQRLGMVQTMYKILNDFDMVLTSLGDSKKNVFFNHEQVFFAKDNYQLSLDLHFDEQSNILLDLKEDGEIILTGERAYFLTDNTFHPLSEELPHKFYKEIFGGHNKFSIEMFFSFKDSLLPILERLHSIKLSKDVKELANLQVEKKVAPLVLEIGKTAHFITVEFKYNVGGELFKVGDYKYAETVNWMDKPREIKIVKEADALVQYLSDLEVSEDQMRELFEGTRIRPNFSQKTPFATNLQISYLEPFIKQIMPKAEGLYNIHFKNGETLRLADGNVRFELETDLTRRLNLFEFKVKFKIEDEYFDLDFLKDLMQKNKKFVQLSDGTTVNIENIREINKWIEFLNRYEFKRTEGKYKAESEAALELDEFLRDFNEKNIKSNEEYRNLIQEMKEKKPVEEIHIPLTDGVVLRQYQKEGVYWMNFLKKYGFGGILADEMGLGKTIQALCVLAMNPGQLHLVVCPKTLVYNWESEIKKFYPNMRVLLVDGVSERREKLIKAIEPDQYDVIITSYSMLQKDYIHYVEENITFDYKVLDEAHYVKNMKTLSAKAVRVVKANHRILLTGTPLENNLEELYGTFDLIMPEYLGSKLDFRKDFISKIERNNMISLEILQAKIRPFILRRVKKEVLKELPDKQEQIVYNEMTNKQVAIYNEVLLRVKQEAMELVEKQGFDRSRIQILSALLKLRQICNHPLLLDKSFKDEVGISGKHEQFLELLEEVVEGGEKALIFSQFTSMLDIFEKDLDEKKIKYIRLDGSTKNRQELVDQFNEDETIKVFLISLKAGGVGLNLTAASSVFLYDPWWNPMAEQQAIDRAHRIGQTKKVNIYKFITKNSIEEKILKLQKRKGNLFENLVVEDRGYVKKLEWDDLMELFED